MDLLVNQFAMVCLCDLLQFFEVSGISLSNFSPYRFLWEFRYHLLNLKKKIHLTVSKRVQVNKCQITSEKKINGVFQFQVIFDA